VCRLAGERGRTVVPHAWKTNLSITATAHLAAVTPHCPFIEYLPAPLSGSALRRELVKTSIEMVDGRLELSREPGLGISVNQEALAKFEEFAARKYRATHANRSFVS
jgi:L-alanine-DL-glutamate epimerase-like enolase superfamily enzyme